MAISELRIGNETNGLLLKETLSEDISELPSLKYDSTTGEVKYGFVSGGISPQNGILRWDGSSYNPYSTSTTGKFDNSITDPSATTRLNYNGTFCATRFANSYLLLDPTASDSNYVFNTNHNIDGPVFVVKNYGTECFSVNPGDEYNYIRIGTPTDGYILTMSKGVTGQVLRYNGGIGMWANSAVGSNGQIQFNLSNSLGASQYLYYNSTNHSLSIGNRIIGGEPASGLWSFSHGGIIGGSTASGHSSAAFNGSQAINQYSFAANNGLASSYASASFNNGESVGNYSFATNAGITDGAYAFACGGGEGSSVQMAGANYSAVIGGYGNQTYSINAVVIGGHDGVISGSCDGCVLLAPRPRIGDPTMFTRSGVTYSVFAPKYETLDNGEGLIVITPDGSKRYKISVNNSGTIISTLVS